jgi:hypothetical protein
VRDPRLTTMETLIGTVITCTVVFSSWHDKLNYPVNIKAENMECTVIDDRLDKVGSPDYWRTPIIVDCEKSIRWLKPFMSNGIFQFFKEDGDCDYDYVK